MVMRVTPEILDMMAPPAGRVPGAAVAPTAGAASKPLPAPGGGEAPPDLAAINAGGGFDTSTPEGRRQAFQFAQQLRMDLRRKCAMGDRNACAALQNMAPGFVRLRPGMQQRGPGPVGSQSFRMGGGGPGPVGGG